MYIYLYIYIDISHKTKSCDIWLPLKSQLGMRFLTWSIVLYSFELLNISIVFTNMTWKPKSEQNDELSNVTRFACANFILVLHTHLSSDYQNVF